MGILFESWTVDVLVIFVITVLGLYYHGTKTFGHWKKSGIKFVEPLPFFGNSLDAVLTGKSVAILYRDTYNAFPGERYLGMFMLRTPTLFIRDPYLVTRVMVKDFSHFYNRAAKFDEKLEPLRANLIFLTDQRWKNLRYKLTPVFSSSKLKTMYDQLDECAGHMESYLRDSIKQDNLLEMRECMAKYTTDVIGSCAFGVQFNALKDPDSEFRRMGRQVFEPSHRHMVIAALSAIHPLLPKMFRLKSIAPEIENFYINFVKATVQYREQNNIKRNDFIQLLIDIRKEDVSGASKFVKNKYANGQVDEVVNKEVILDDELMAANAFVFYAAGFETTASTMAYCLLELAANLDIQDKLREEIMNVITENSGKLTYDVIKDFTYMDKVISETLRKYPVAGFMTRKCSKTYQVPDSDLVIEKDMNVLIPVYALHHDPQYYPEPERFDPERFSEENLKKRPDGTYLPFGDGPRICIGQRLARMGMKVNFCKILPKFEFRMSNKMKYPLEYDHKAKYTLLIPLNGIWLNVYERK